MNNCVFCLNRWKIKVDGYREVAEEWMCYWCYHGWTIPPQNRQTPIPHIDGKRGTRVPVNDQQIALVMQCYRLGMSIVDTMRETNVNRNGVRRMYGEFARIIGPVKCPCGATANHKSLCKARKYHLYSNVQVDTIIPTE